jgi:hypothetical protein
MSQPLAKVTGQLDAPRGPDVEFQIVVPVSWFGSSVEVELPRNLNCGHCQGGGCDRCDRSGALTLRARDAEAEKISVSLPSRTDHALADVCLRIPGSGAEDPSGELGPGHLLLTVRAGADFSPCVRLLESKKVSSAEEERLQIIRRSVVMAVGLILLFIGLLRLSGWI